MDGRVLFVALFTSGCIGATVRGGAEVQSPVAGAGVLEARAGIDAGYVRANAVGGVRANARFAEVALGPELCARNLGWRTGLFCASVPVALGSEGRQLTFGISPTVTGALWQPTKKKPARKSQSRTASRIASAADQFTPGVVPALSLGMHWRPVGPTRATPFLQLTFGGGLGRSNMYGVP